MPDPISITLERDHLEAENVGEFYPEAVQAATGILKQLLRGDVARDAPVFAACAVSCALQALCDSPQSSREQRLEEALREIRMLTVNEGDTPQAAIRASEIALAALSPDSKRVDLGPARMRVVDAPNGGLDVVPDSKGVG